MHAALSLAPTREPRRTQVHLVSISDESTWVIADAIRGEDGWSARIDARVALAERASIGARVRCLRWCDDRWYEDVCRVAAHAMCGETVEIELVPLEETRMHAAESGSIPRT